MPGPSTPLVAPDLTGLEGLLVGRASWAGSGNGAPLALDVSVMPKVIRTHLSVSTAHAIASCPARWAIESLLPRSSDPFGAAELGTATHQLFEDLFTLPGEARTLLEAKQLLGRLHETHPELAAPAATETETLGRWRAEIDQRMVGLWDIEDPTDVEVLATEQKIRTVVARVPFIGFIDRVAAGPGGQRLLVDFKTGARPRTVRFGDHHGDQLRLYAMALAASTDRVLPASAAVYYVAQGRSRRVSLARNHLIRSRDGFVEAWEQLGQLSETGEFPTRPSPLCGWCPLAQVCPAAAAAGKDAARHPVALVGPALGIALAPAVVRGERCGVAGWAALMQR